MIRRRELLSLIHKHPCSLCWSKPLWVLPWHPKAPQPVPDHCQSSSGALHQELRFFCQVKSSEFCRWGNAKVPSVVCRKCWDICVVSLDPVLKPSHRFLMERSLISTCRALKYHDTVLLLMKINLDLCSLVC